MLILHASSFYTPPIIERVNGHDTVKADEFVLAPESPQLA